MAKFELSIYGENDDVIKKYETEHVRWGLFMQAMEISEQIRDKSEFEKIKAVSPLIKKVFVGLTDEHLELADGFDVINTFNQIVSGAKNIKGGNSKNV